MKKYFSIGLGLLFAAGILAGCGKTTQTSSPLGGNTLGSGTSNGSAVQQAQVTDQLAANPTLVNEDVYESLTPMDMSTGSGFATVRPLRWWRQITSVDRSFDITTALVTVHRHLLGTFDILAGDSTATVVRPDTSRHLVRKPLDDDWERHVFLARELPDTSWRIVGTSGVQVTAKDAATHIVSVRIQAGVIDTLITDPLAMYRLRRVVCIAPHTQVQITVTTGSPTDQLFFYHADGRFRFHSNGDGTFSARWTTSLFGGLRHFGVDAISYGTLFDDTAPYDSQAWIIPFAVNDRDADLDRR